MCQPLKLSRRGEERSGDQYVAPEAEGEGTQRTGHGHRCRETLRGEEEEWVGRWESGKAEVFQERFSSRRGEEREGEGHGPGFEQI